MIPYSVLDLAPVPVGLPLRTALGNVLDLARHAEGWGYHRFWLAEHHNMPGIASAATAVLIGHVASGTTRIRVGAGGIMLPNHAPLVVAEQFGTLAELHGDRIDLGLGRAPGTDMPTARALRRSLDSGDGFPADVAELLAYLGEPEPGARVRAIPGEGTRVPVWILGSSLYGAQLAAHFGLPYAFASHFAPAALEPALATYRRDFRPTKYGERPRFMLALNVFAAATDAEARYLRSSMVQAFANLARGRPGRLPPPVEDVERVVDPAGLAAAEQALACSAIGSPDRVASDLAAFVARYRPDEVILTSQVHDHAARLASLRIAAEAMTALEPVPG